MSKLALKDSTGGLEEGEGPLAGRNESVCGVGGVTHLIM